MLIKAFRIKNYKGISNLRIETSGDVTTLIGLNESGKTTILEAISRYLSEDKDITEVIGNKVRGSDLHDVIPKHLSANFSGAIDIAALIELEESDVDALEKCFAEKYNLDLVRENLVRELSVFTSYQFKNSRLENTSHKWGIEFPVIDKSKQRKKKMTIGHKIDSDPDEKRKWSAAIAVLKELHPKIAYFPTFIVDFPERIYLDRNNSNDRKNSYYVDIIQDILDSNSNGLDIQTHIVDRIKRVLATHRPPAFASVFSASPEKRQIDSVIQVVSSEISNSIFGAWNEIFGRKVEGKRIHIDWALDPDRSYMPYIEISIIDGISRYSLSERSLGFRWFFAFLLFTNFRKNRKQGGGTVFLFDEPAANLHSKAQMKLIETFGRISGRLSKIIYSTHSHYMINPVWLESSYIIRNKADKIDSDEFSSDGANNTEIVSEKYRSFVGRHPNQTTYFQPVLDALDVGFSNLQMESKAIIVEGKYDYHPIVYLRRISGSDKVGGIFPVNGAGNAERLISLFRGWAVDFHILLDDDDAGKAAKTRYIDDFLLDDSKVLTLGDIDDALKGRSFESVYQVDVKQSIINRYKVPKPKKKHYSMLFRELLNESAAPIQFEDTQKAFEKIRIWIENKLQ